jgi:hypothetical protein
MDLQSMFGGKALENTAEKQPAFEYKAQIMCPTCGSNGELVIEEDYLKVTTWFDHEHNIDKVDYYTINAISLEDYVVFLYTWYGRYKFSYLGSFCEAFYDELLTAYNAAVLRSLFVSGNPLLTASGDYRYTESGATAAGAAPIAVFDNCVTVLPPDLSARRIPLCFVQRINKGDFECTLCLDTGENYTFARLGYDTEPFEDVIEKQIRAIREANFAAVKGISPALSSAQVSQIIKLLPAMPKGALAEIAPEFLQAIEGKLTNSCISEYYSALMEISVPELIHVSFKDTPPKEAPAEINPLEALQDTAEADEIPAPDPYLIWVIAPSKDGQYAIVEFAAENSATYIYRTGGDFTAFVHTLSRALEAIDHKREVITLSDDELKKPENTDYLMASLRTPALQFVRGNFAGKAIHSNVSAWKRKITQMLTQKSDVRD